MWGSYSKIVQTINRGGLLVSARGLTDAVQKRCQQYRSKIERKLRILMLSCAYQIRRKLRHKTEPKLRILMLSCTHQIGHGVAVVVDLQSRFLSERNHKVFVGGHAGKNDFSYDGCERVILTSPYEAACFAFENDMDCVVMHTPPFYSVAKWLGQVIKTIAYDYGEPNPDFFPDADARKAVLFEKHSSMLMADRIYAISDSVRDESRLEQVEVIPLGNSHLAIWKAESIQRRIDVRTENNWSDKIVVLNVCRFHEAEQYYKGIDTYISVLEEIERSEPEWAARFIFALAGKATEQDTEKMQKAGLSVFPNISDGSLIDLYLAADIYVNFSRWEGYNLGIGQALAMGLPAIASDIPAHRAFGIFISDDPKVIVEKLISHAEDGVSFLDGNPDRHPIINDWNIPLKQFANVIEGIYSLEDSSGIKWNRSATSIKKIS